jgi:osmotically-inducible protein OsmY
MPKIGRKSGGAILAHEPHVLVLGTSRTSQRIYQELEKAGIPAQRLASSEQTDNAVQETTRALIIVPPIADVSVAHYCQDFREDNEQLPVFVAVQGTLPSRGIRKLYKSGVQAVFEWPADKEPLVRTAFRIAGATARNKATKLASADIALEELINDHLHTASTKFGPRLFAQVLHRYAIMKGSVDALWKLHIAAKVASQVPGVDDVVTSGVQVTGPAQSDRAIANAIRQVLKHASEVDTSTLTIRVDKGNVSLDGTSADRQELGRAIELISHVRGVRRIENLATLSATGKRQDKHVLKRIEKALATHHPKFKIAVTLFGGVAVLSGKVQRAADRMAVEALVAGQDGVDRVVDKIRVR